jgi:tetratricopeptide (TPR) repeat protein
MGTILMNAIFNKKTLIAVSVIFIFAVLGGVTYLTVQRLLPTSQQVNNSNNSQKSTAEKSYNNAIEAEKKNDYNTAISSYQTALPYYKDAGNSSIQDMNTAYNIEARIKAISAHKAALDKLESEAKSNPNVQFFK